MSISNSHKNAVDRQFGEQANAYLTSAVHAQGKDLQRLAQLLEPHAGARLLDLGCGAGHASFTAAAVVAQVVAYDLSAQMLAVVEQAAAEKGLSNIQLQQGVAESLPFEDASFDLVISRYSAHHWHDVGGRCVRSSGYSSRAAERSLWTWSRRGIRCWISICKPWKCCATPHTCATMRRASGWRY